MANMVRLIRAKAPPTGLLGGLTAMLACSVHGITSMGCDHAFLAIATTHALCL